MIISNITYEFIFNNANRLREKVFLPNENGTMAVSENHYTNINTHKTNNIIAGKTYSVIQLTLNSKVIFMLENK
jgi:hypothetical protein